MARRRKAHIAHHDRWLVSYADLLTLLFAFFVVMFASTQSDHSRAKEISEAVDKAFRNGSFSPRLASVLGGTPADTGHGSIQVRVGNHVVAKEQLPADPGRPPDLSSALHTLQTELDDEITSKSVRVLLEERGVVISLKAQLIFPSGDDTIDDRVYPTIAKVADVVRHLPNALRLEGHTDSMPINNGRFRSNWELSAARSIAMLRLLHERYGIASDRMAVIGYGETNSVADNATEEGRTLNRRVDIVIVNTFGMRVEPGPSPNEPSTQSIQ